jgi:midasin
MDDQVVALHDLRTFNIRGQIQKLLQTCPASTPHAPMLRDATTYGERANALAKLLLVPALTSAVAKFFRPILTDICARLLHDDELLEEKFVALASLLQPHIELFS